MQLAKAVRSLPTLSAGLRSCRPPFADHSQSWSLRPDEGRRVLQFWHGEAAELGYACVLNNACESLHCWCVHVCPRSACWAVVCVCLGRVCLCGSVCVCWCVRIYIWGGGGGRSALSGRSVCLWLHFCKHPQVCISTPPTPTPPHSASKDGVGIEKEGEPAVINKQDDDDDYHFERSCMI